MTMSPEELAAHEAAKAAHAAAQSVDEPSIGAVLGVLRSLRKEIATLASKFRTQKVITAIAIAGLVLDLCLSASFLYLNHRVGTQASTASINCQANREFGHGMQGAFGPLIDEGLEHPETIPEDQREKQLQTLRRFKSFIDGQANRKCAQAGSTFIGLFVTVGVVLSVCGLIAIAWVKGLGGWLVRKFGSGDDLDE